MKKLIICLFIILITGITSAQEYKYFDLTFKGNSIVGFSPKHLKPGSMERTRGKKMIQELYRLNKYYFDSYMPIYYEIFGTEFKVENWKILRSISCDFWFREDFKPYYYQISFPTALLDEFPQWEEKLYRLCEKSMKVDVRANFGDIQPPVSVISGHFSWLRFFWKD